MSLPVEVILYWVVLPFWTLISVPGGSLALSCRVFQRASGGTQKTFFSR